MLIPGSKAPAATHHHASGGRTHARDLPRVERMVRHGWHPLHASPRVATGAQQRRQVDLLPRLHLVLLLLGRRPAVGLRRQQLRQQRALLLLALELLLLLGRHAQGLHAGLGRQPHPGRAVLHASRRGPPVLQLHGRLHAGGRRRLHACQHVPRGHVAGGRVGRPGGRPHVPRVLHGVHARRQLPRAKALHARRGRPPLVGAARVLVPHGRHAPRQKVLRHAAAVLLRLLLLRAAARLLLLLLPRWRLPGVARHVVIQALQTQQEGGGDSSGGGQAAAGAAPEQRRSSAVSVGTSCFSSLRLVCQQEQRICQAVPPTQCCCRGQRRPGKVLASFC